MTHYDTLQVSPTASPEVITASWKALVRKFHPDTNKATSAKPKMLALNEAYEVLSNPAKRKEYDRTLNVGANGFVRNERTNGHSKKAPKTAYGSAYGKAYGHHSQEEGLVEQFIGNAVSRGEFNIEALLTQMNQIALQKIMEANPTLAMLIKQMGNK